METFVIALAALACPIGMGLMMMFMAKGMKGEAPKEEAQAATSGDVDELRAEQERLVAEVARLKGERAGGSELVGRA